MKVVGLIPARYAATRLPGKPLSEINGKPMVQWVYEKASQAESLNEVWVATDDERILKAVEAFGGRAVMTSKELTSGTDRIAQAADQIGADVYVNIQGDEPMMDPHGIDLATALVVSGRFQMASLMTPLKTQQDLENPTVVKVITDASARAIYFSRFPIPYSRHSPIETGDMPGGEFACKRHVGLYVYTREVLFKFRSLPPSKLEKGEMLEQLRALANGISIGMAEADFESIGVDTPEDLERVRSILVNGAKNHG